MKRKRGPAPSKKETKAKDVAVEEVEGMHGSDEETGFENADDSSFHGFSSDGDEMQVDGQETSTNGQQNGQSKQRTKGKKAEPTQEELMELMFRSSSFQSNLFKLQVDELLSEVRVKYDKMDKVEKLLHQLKEVLTNVPETAEQLLHAFESKMKSEHHIRVPFPNPPPPKDALYKFKFEKPSSIKLVGSYGLKAAAKSSEGFTIDVSVTMPDSIFTEKDYLDHRYFYKRACYLASLAAGIKSSDLHVSIAFEHLHGDERKPILVLSSLQDGSDNDFSKTRAQIRILPTISRTTFPASKLLASKCNIRTSPSTPTPLYNSAILSDTLPFYFLSQLYSSSKSCSAFLDGSLLGRIWLRQRGLSGSFCNGGFGAFEWTWFVSYLLRSGGPNGRNVLDVGFSSFQLFRGALNSLVMKDRVVGDSSVECIDEESGMNIFYKTTPMSYKVLQSEAARTLSMLSESVDDVFGAIFLTKVDNPLLRFDLSARLSIPVAENNPDSPSQAFTAISRTTSILQTALTTRVTLISVASSPNLSFALTSSPSSSPTTLTIGLLIDPESSRRLVDHGPPASEPTKATQFRNFWGEKAELRRFKDGSILESVVWNCKTTEDRYAIVKRIVRYVIARHISAGVAGDIHFLTPTLYPELSSPLKVTGTFLKREGDPFQGLGEAFERFVRELKDLKDVPLGISAVIPVGEGLTHTSVWSPYSQNYNKLSSQQAGEYYVPVQEVILQFEGSGKWPDDLKAIQKVKIGFLLQIARQLEATYSVSAKVGLMNEDLDIANQGFMDVVYEMGYTFRVMIQHDPNHREATLLERILKNKALSHGEKTRYETALKYYQRTFMRGTAHAQALHALRGKYYFLPNTIRLVKRWIAAHMLSPQISSQAIELIVCYVYCHPHPWHSPASAETGFLRTLKLLSTWDWRREPLIVDLDGSMTISRYEEISKEFEGVRKQDPGIAHAAWSIYCTYDATGPSWTRETPGKAVAARVTALAKSSLEVLSKESGNIKQIFTTPLTDYDFLIQVKSDYSSVTTGSVFKNLQGQGWKDVLVDFNPVQDFLKDLEVCFGDTILWFYDRENGSVIAGLWNPHIVAPRPWKITLGYSSIPVAEASQDNKPLVVLNKQAILNEIARLGAGIVTSISANKS